MLLIPKAHFLLPVKFYSNPKPCNSPVVFFIHQMIPGSEGNQVCVICWCRDGNGTSTAYVRMTQLVGKNLQLIWRETIVIPEDVVMRRSACSLKADHTRSVSASKTSPYIPTSEGELPQNSLLPQSYMGAIQHSKLKAQCMLPVCSGSSLLDVNSTGQSRNTEVVRFVSCVNNNQEHQQPMLCLKVTTPCKMLYLNTSMTTQVEVKLWWMGDFCVHCGTRWNVPTFSNLCEQYMQIY